MLYRLWKCDSHVVKMMLLEIVISVIEGFIAVLLPAAIIQFITTTQDWITLVLQILGLFAVYGLFICLASAQKGAGFNVFLLRN